MKQLHILRVVVASPSDVLAERNVLVEVAEELNRGIARDRALHIDISRWETDAYPGFHVEGPQGLIDLALGIEDCDLLIGIFWKRFGTPTADAKSGTEHEFRKAYEAWKRNKRPQLMIYFKEKPYWPKTRSETDQLGQVLDFKRVFPSEGLWWTYTEKSQFEKLVRNHLTLFIRTIFFADGAQNNSGSTTITSTHSSPPIDDQVSQWLQAKASNSRQTKKSYEENIRKFREVLREHNFDLNSEDVPAISAILQAWAAQGPRRGNVSNSTFNQRQSTISSFYKFALGQQWIKINPIEMVKSREEHKVNEALSLDHTTVNKALKKINRLTLDGKRDYAILCILFTTGAHAAEIADLRCGNVLRTESGVAITTRQRGGKRMKYPLQKGTAQALVDWLTAVYGNEWSTDAPLWISFSWNGSKGQALGSAALSDICKKWLGTSKVEATNRTYKTMVEERGTKGIEDLLDIN